MVEGVWAMKRLLWAWIGTRMARVEVRAKTLDQTIRQGVRLRHGPFESAAVSACAAIARASSPEPSRSLMVNPD
jgi:3-hydroxyacyl-CoA dehydrogenase